MKLSEAIKILEDAGVSDAEYDARQIFSEFGVFSPYELLAKTAESSDTRIISAVEQRAQREPLQYILGKAYFYREKYTVSADCLIPRQDTEILVDFAVKNIPIGESFADICSGSGCIGISVLNNTENTRATFVDISDAAMELAKKNAEDIGVFDRCNFLVADIMKELPEEKFFAVLSNPPYVKDEVYLGLDDEIFHEPKSAFVGGADGGDFYRRLIPSFHKLIKPGGFLALEIGFDQRELIEKLCKDNCLAAEFIKDFSGNYRVAVIRQ